MLTVRDFCSLVKITERQFHILKAQGLGPQITRQGRRLMISQEAVTEFLLAHERRAA